MHFFVARLLSLAEITETYVPYVRNPRSDNVINTLQHRLTINCDIPLATRLDNASLAL